ncbi:MAG: flagellar hook protein FlgE [Devosia sp.]
MSLSAAISSAVSALNAQSSALATVSNNLANSSTVGYKASGTSFAALVAGDVGTASAAGGVSSSQKAAVSTQGLLNTSTVATNVAISGDGMFAVSAKSDSDELLYTRNGEFTTDSEGYLVSNGYYLQGWKTDADGAVVGTATQGALTAIDTDSISSIASATTTASLVANLPAEAAVNDTFTSSMDVYDSLGTAASSEMTWTKTAENVWTVSFADPVLTADPSQTVGTVDAATSTITVTFNGDGTLASTNPAAAALNISGWTTGASDSAISLDLGSSGTSSGLSQYATGAETPSVTVESSPDGVPFGSLSGINVGDDGTVYASYSNGMQLSVYKIAVATFNNANGMSEVSGGLYAQTADSGTASFHLSGEGGAGTILGSRLEASTTDTNLEFSRMMAAQQAYSGAAQAMTAANDMFDTLISAVR